MLVKIIKNFKEKFKDEKSLFLMDINLRDDYYKEMETFQDAYNFYKTHSEEMKISKKDEETIYNFFEFIFNLGDYLTPLNFKDIIFTFKEKENQIKHSFLLLDCSYLFDDLKSIGTLLNYIEKNNIFLNEKERQKFSFYKILLPLIEGNEKEAEKIFQKSFKPNEGFAENEKIKFLIQIRTYSFELYEKFMRNLNFDEKDKIFEDETNYKIDEIMKKYFESLKNKAPFEEKYYRIIFQRILKESKFSFEQLEKLIDFLSKIDTYFLNNHSKEVKDMALKISYAGKKIWGREIEMDKIEKGAYFHDLGKLDLPWMLLDKKITLNEKEKEKFKNHSLFSYEILKNSGFEEEAIYVLEHHKYLNGKGYPNDNLKPTFEGNIICLAESFIGAVNLASKTKVREKEELFIEFKQLRGLYFYPEVVDALLLLE